ncbi:MAG: hypothetical protein JW863_15620 [Chitinispirillaceae bacterium]|nr:hypothetical protein [Chitinispirillaceae bacterium]
MGILIDKATEGLRNAGGIAYEVPVVTGAVNLRAVVSTPIKKIGIVHRECLDNFIAANVSFCKKESIDIISISLPNKSSLFKWKIKSALKTLSRNKIDALWIPNDNLLLQRDNLFDVWIPAADKLEIPVIVGIETLVDPKLDFGTLAVLPDHVGLGKQTADMIYELSGNNWKFKEHQIFPPLAIHKIINLRQAKERFNISDDKLGIIDKKLE